MFAAVGNTTRCWRDDIGPTLKFQEMIKCYCYCAIVGPTVVWVLLPSNGLTFAKKKYVGDTALR